MSVAWQIPLTLRYRITEFVQRELQCGDACSRRRHGRQSMPPKFVRGTVSRECTMILHGASMLNLVIDERCNINCHTAAVAQPPNASIPTRPSHAFGSKNMCTYARFLQYPSEVQVNSHTDLTVYAADRLPQIRLRGATPWERRLPKTNSTLPYASHLRVLSLVYRSLTLVRVLSPQRRQHAVTIDPVRTADRGLPPV